MDVNRIQEIKDYLHGRANPGDAILTAVQENIERDTLLYIIEMLESLLEPLKDVKTPGRLR